MARAPENATYTVCPAKELRSLTADSPHDGIPELIEFLVSSEDKEALKLLARDLPKKPAAVRTEMTNHIHLHFGGGSPWRVNKNLPLGAAMREVVEACLGAMLVDDDNEFEMDSLNLTAGEKAAWTLAQAVPERYGFFDASASYSVLCEFAAHPPESACGLFIRLVRSSQPEGVTMTVWSSRASLTAPPRYWYWAGHVNLGDKVLLPANRATSVSETKAGGCEPWQMWSQAADAALNGDGAQEMVMRIGVMVRGGGSG